MPLVAPNLDDRKFDDLVAELVRRIPRYLPEWTDHNPSDPGITLLELYAWLTEMTLYRLNRVPERLHVKFLELLGTGPAPARAARADLTFEIGRDDLETVIVPRGTQVAAGGGSADAAGGGEPVIFETDEALVALGAKLAAVQVFDGFAWSPVTLQNATDGEDFRPFGPAARPGAALVLGFSSPLDFTAQPFTVTVELAPRPGAARSRRPEDRGALECEPGASALPPPATVVWEFWDGRHWLPMAVDRDDSRAFTRDGRIFLRGPGRRARRARLGAAAEELYHLRARLESAGYETAPRLAAVILNTVGATQAETVRDEVLGGSDGRPDQRFVVDQVPVLARSRPETVAAAGGRTVTVESLRLEVNEGASPEDFEVWQEVADFFRSGPDDPHYVLDRTSGEVRFGDGRRGRIPLANPDLPNANVVAREYRVGGGPGGNAGAGEINELQSYVPGASGVKNRRAAIGGRAEESLDDAKLRAAHEIRTRGRAVTAEDFEVLAVETPGADVARAKALPLRHPRYAGDVPGVVSVVVVPERRPDDPDAAAPRPSAATLRAVCAYLDRHRLLTTELHVVGPIYREVTVEADVVARGDADLAEVSRRLDGALRRFFDPLTGGRDGRGWEFGRDVFYSEVYRVVLETEGVERILDNQLVLWLDGERQPFCRDVPICRGELVTSGEHQLRLAYGFAD